MTPLPTRLSTALLPERAALHGMHTSVELCALSGATYRKVDYWTRVGLIAADVAAQGSGSGRLWSDAEVRATTALEWCSAHGIAPTSPLAGVMAAAARAEEPYAEFGPACVDMRALLAS